MMNICYVANSRFPSERAHMTQIVEMCNAFVEAGNNVTLLVTDRVTHITETPEQFFGMKFRFETVRVPVPDIAGRSARIPNRLRPVAFFFQRVVFAIRAAWYVRTHPCDCVYGRDEWILWLMSFFIAQRIVWESHEARYSFAAKRLIASNAPLIVISEGIRDFYTRQGVKTKQMFVAHDAVNSTFFNPHVSTSDARNLLGITATKPIVMYIGGFEAWKGAEILFQASQNAKRFITYVIGGKSEEIAKFSEMYPWVHFLGPRPYRELPVYQQAADILVIPNTATNPVSAEYTSPLKLFAHMTSGKPIVASATASIRNVLSDDAAYFFTPDDVKSLIEIVHTVLDNQEDSLRRAHRALEMSFFYTWGKRAGRISNFLVQYKN